jgi:hypothetical protein
MALHAGFGGQAMETAFLFDEGLYGFMAFQTFFIGHAFSRIVTLKAVFVLQVLVAFYERSRSEKFAEKSFLFSPGYICKDRDNDKNKK